MISPKREAIMAALSQIDDPELGLDLVSLGLVYDLQIDAGAVRVQMTLTTPGCPLIDTIVGQVRTVVSRVPGVKSVAVDLTFHPPWTPDRMSEEARTLLGFDASGTSKQRVPATVRRHT